MDFAPGVRTRTIVCSRPHPPVNIYPDQILETRVKVTTTRGLIWNDEPIVKMVDTPVQNTNTGEVSFVAMVTDMEGMVDAKTMQMIDISNGRHTHLLNIKIKYFHLARLAWEVTRLIPVPTGIEPIDLDSLLNPNPQEGILVPRPAVSYQQVSDVVNQFLEQNEIPNYTYVDNAITEHVDADLPHPAYDDMPDLTLIFNNGLI